MLIRYWILVLAIGGATVAVALSLFPARLSLGSRPAFGEGAGRAPEGGFSHLLGAAPAVHAMAPTSREGFSKQQLELLVAGLVGSFVVGAIVASAFLFSRGVSADDPTPCEDFGHAQAFLATGGLPEGSPTLAERVLGDAEDESTRVVQLRTMFDRCYYSAKK
jgi:hypothetical protein